MSSNSPMRVAYMMSRFPKVTETFILYEMIAVEEEGVDVFIYPLMRERGGVVHEEAKPLVERAYYTPWINMPMLTSNVKMFLRKPWVYVTLFFKMLFWTWGSIRFFTGVPAFYLKAMHLADKMEQDGIQHLHAHFVTHPAAVAYIIHQFTGIPYSMTAHGADLQREQQMLLQKVEDAKTVVSVSLYNEKLLIDFCGEQFADKIEIVRCGINMDRFRERDASDSDEVFSIVCTGTLHEVKGQRYLIEACGKLKERGVEFQCYFVGDGPDRQMLVDLAAELDVTDNVNFLGYISQDEVAARLMASDVFVLSSVPTSDNLREGIPVSLMEAMACAIPVVSSRLSGIPELIEEDVHGVLAEARDSTGIADALEKYYRDPEFREKVGKAGREKVLEEFELHSNARRLISLFQEG